LSVETPLFASMLVQPQPQAEEGIKIPLAPAPPSTISGPSPTDLQDPKPTPPATPPQGQPLTPHDSPPHNQSSTPYESYMPLLTTLIKNICYSLIKAINADEGITLVDVKTNEEVVAMDAVSQGRLNQEDVNATSKEVSVVSASKLVSAVEPTMFDDEDVTMTMA
nr:hypothetical protein [Tanacetum cinerariifolium]